MENIAYETDRLFNDQLDVMADMGTIENGGTINVNGAEWELKEYLALYGLIILSDED